MQVFGICIFMPPNHLYMISAKTFIQGKALTARQNREPIVEVYLISQFSVLNPKCLIVLVDALVFWVAVTKY
jgi:hypothetical protein